MTRHLIKGGLLLTGETEAVARRADILVTDGRIAAIEERIDADCPAIDASACLVTPGFIDTSRHTWQTLTRGVCGDMTGAGYWTSIRHRAAMCHSPDDLRIGNLAGMVEAINAGVTTVFDFSNNVPGAEHVDALIDGAVEAGIRCRFAPAFNAVAGEAVELATPAGRHALLEQLRRNRLASDEGLVTLAAGLSDIVIVGIDVVASEIALCRRLGLRMTLNCEAFRPDPAVSELDQLDAAGLLGPDLLFVHMMMATSDQLGRVRDTGGSISICPETALALGHQLPATLRVMRAGLAPTFGTDVTANWSGDLFAQARLALQVGRLETNAPENAAFQSGPFQNWPTCRDMFDALTRSAAKAVGLGDEIGTLTVGKQADIVLLRSDDINMVPLNDPYSAVILQANPSNVDTVFIAGGLRKREGRLLHDMASLRRSVTNAHDRLLERVAAMGGWLPDGNADADTAYTVIDA